MLKKLKIAYQNSIAIIFILGLWEILPAAGLINPHSLPPFSDVVESLLGLTLSGRIFQHMFASLSRSFVGFILAIAFSVPLGFITGWFKRAERIGDPLLQFFRNTPSLALYPLFILIFGLGEFSKFAIIFWGTLWPILINTTEGVRSIGDIHIKAARTMGAGQLAMFRKVLFPAAFPSIITGLRLGAARSILVLVAAEMLGADKGLGYLVFDSQYRYEIPEMYAAIIVLVLIGLVTNYLLVHFERRITRWKEAVHA